jgi:hypothetical protein
LEVIKKRELENFVLFVQLRNACRELNVIQQHF